MKAQLFMVPNCIGCIIVAIILPEMQASHWGLASHAVSHTGIIILSQFKYASNQQQIVL